MYHLPHFKANHPEDVFAFMQAHPLVTLCGTTSEDWPVATHIPILIHQRNDTIFITGHLMRNQVHTNAFEVNPKVLAIFQGADSYISASWYSQPSQASTWNYMSVHASGIMRFLDDKALYELLVQQTRYFEGQSHSVADVDKMSTDYVQENMKAIVAFEIEVTACNHVFKLSQNKDAQSFHSVVTHLQNGNALQKDLANEMLKTKI
ncbi:FMN-binding negative transcriptional regulator [Hydrotalea sp.]|uniref:FMN-binding negative transcriptional regulator n=1 Tax=Hydrotalea sp. TaxID=2881279 RepID=UPI002631EFE8|nr:FMN-binding negative transcriptional regulator [Hydrotalea sp.]